MGSRDKFYSIETLSHGYDEIGVLQTGGTINSVAKYGATGKWAKYALVTASAAHNLTRGECIHVMGTTDYDGPTRVVAIVNSTQFVIRRPFTITKTGTWDRRSAEGNFDGFRVLNGDLAAGTATFVYWRPDMQGGLDGTFSFTKDVLYKVPGGIKSIILSTAATSPTAPTVRLIRGASTQPGAVRNPEAAVVIGYNPTGATAGATVDILGKNFSPTPDNNVVSFSNGAKFVPVIGSDKEGGVLTVLLPTGVITGPVTVKSHGLATATGPTFNIN